MKIRIQPTLSLLILSLALILGGGVMPANGADPLEETFVRDVPCGDILAKMSLLESCQELETFFAKWEPRAKQGDPLAMTLIGLKYFQHEPTRKKAPEYFSQAARQGFAPAQLELGMLYENGEVVPKDDLQAFLWFSLAAAKGEQKAVSCLQNLKAGMNPQRQAAGQELVKQWRPTPYDTAHPLNIEETPATTFTRQKP
jgi:hypothetical protein